MLTDCISKDPSVAELLIVRRGKAATMAKSMRNRFTQAILPMDGRIVGATDGGLAEALDNPGAKQIVCALGVGIDYDGLGPGVFRLDLLRYGKIILAFNDSPQGRAIQEATLAFLDRYLRPVVAEGHVYTMTPGPSAGMSEAEFEHTIMAPETRSLVKLSA